MRRLLPERGYPVHSQSCRHRFHGRGRSACRASRRRGDDAHQKARKRSPKKPKKPNKPKEPKEAAGEAPANGRVADRIVAIAVANKVECWHTRDHTAYMTVPVTPKSGMTHWETSHVQSPEFREWLEYHYYKTTHSIAANEAVTAAQNILSVTARYDGAEHEVALRLAERDGIIYLDLGDPGWRVIEIRPDGWGLARQCPIRFRRTPHMCALPWPEPGGSIEELRPLVNVRDEIDWILFVAWLLGAFQPRGPYPVLNFVGGPGVAKSYAMMTARSVIDPHEPLIRRQPRTERDLMIGAFNAWICAYDNLSWIPTWLSNDLCQLATTGAGSGTRKLYTDLGEVVLNLKRAIMWTSIGETAVQEDLVHRLILLRLADIDDAERMTDEEHAERLAAVRPRVLGALLDAVSMGLRQKTTVRPPKLPRLASFVRWVAACEAGLGWKPGTFFNAYVTRQRQAAALIIESSPVGTALMGFMEDWSSEKPYETTATGLLADLATWIDDASVRKDHRRWPRNARALRASLDRLSPHLKQLGLTVGYAKESDSTRTRKIRLGIVTPASAEGAERGAPQFSQGDRPDGPDRPTSTPDAEQTSDGSDGSDGREAYFGGSPSATQRRASSGRNPKGEKEKEGRRDAAKVVRPKRRGHWARLTPAEQAEADQAADADWEAERRRHDPPDDLDLGREHDPPDEGARDDDPPDDVTLDDAGDGEEDDVPRPVPAVRTTTPKAASSPPSTPKPSSGKQSETTSPTSTERPLWTRRPPRELTDAEAETWENARRHVDPEREEYAADHLERQQWMAHLERLDEVAARRRARQAGGTART